MLVHLTTDAARWPSSGTARSMFFRNRLPRPGAAVGPRSPDGDVLRGPARRHRVRPRHAVRGRGAPLEPPRPADARRAGAPATSSSWIPAGVRAGGPGVGVPRRPGGPGGAASGACCGRRPDAARQPRDPAVLQRARRAPPVRLGGRPAGGARCSTAGSAAAVGRETALTRRVEARRRARATPQRGDRLRASVRQDELDTVLAAAREANGLIDRRTFSWTALFNYLEATLPAGVMLTSVQPRVKDGGFTVSLGVLGRPVDDIDEFLGRLEDTGAFSELLSRDETPEEERTAPPPWPVATTRRRQRRPRRPGRGHAGGRRPRRERAADDAGLPGCFARSGHGWCPCCWWRWPTPGCICWGWLPLRARVAAMEQRAAPPRLTCERRPRSSNSRRNTVEGRSARDRAVAEVLRGGPARRPGRGPPHHLSRTRQARAGREPAGQPAGTRRGSREGERLFRLDTSMVLEGKYADLREFIYRSRPLPSSSSSTAWRWPRGERARTSCSR